MNSTNEIRSNYSQQKYRKNSNSKLKSMKHVAHIVDLEIVKTIQQKTPGKPSIRSLKRVFNHPSNYRMVKVETNLKEHRNLVKKLNSKKRGNLNQKDSKRVKRQVKVIRGNSNQLPSGFYKSARKFYKNFKDSNGRTVWDERSKNQ